jgi:hypothetical protein
MTTRDRDLFDAGLIGPRKDAFRPDPSDSVRWRRAIERDVVAPFRRVGATLARALRAYWRRLSPFERVGDAVAYVLFALVLAWLAVVVLPQMVGLNDRVQAGVEARAR